MEHSHNPELWSRRRVRGASVPTPLWEPYSSQSILAQLKQARILLVDDEESILLSLRQVLSKAGYTRLSETSDPLQVSVSFERFRPDLIVLDLHMAPVDGFGVLEELAPLIPASTYLPILVLTGEDSTAAKHRALSLGAKDFLTKPFEPQELLLRIHNLLLPRFMHLRLRDENQFLEVRVLARTQALTEARLEVLECLGRAADFRDDSTGQHVRRVGRTASLLAAAAGLDAITVELIERAAPLHDIGKIGIPDQILSKAGKLAPEEFAVMAQHPTSSCPTSEGLSSLSGFGSLPAGRDVPIIAIPGFQTDLAELQKQDAGFTQFLVKPVDSSLLLTMVRAYLCPVACGFEVVGAADGAEALALARANPPHVIVSDVLMPKLDGFRLAAAVKCDPWIASFPVVLVSSAYTGDDDRKLAQEGGAAPGS